jgi:hypothetical protein
MSSFATFPTRAPQRAVACSVCPRAAFFQARLESAAGHERILRRVNACASHLVEVILQLRAWARRHHVTRGWLTTLAIDPYAMPRLAALGITDPGFTFYSAPLTQPIAAAIIEEDFQDA